MMVVEDTNAKKYKGSDIPKYDSTAGGVSEYQIAQLPLLGPIPHCPNGDS